MRLNLNDKVLMGMGIESVRVADGIFEIVTPGTEVTLKSGGGLSVQQRIGVHREVLTCRLPEHLSPWRLAEWTPFRCVLSSNGLNLTVQGDSVLIFAPQQHMKLTFEGHFKPHYAQEVRGNRLLLDPVGGCGFFGIPPRPAELENSETDSWLLKCHLARWDELWVCVCPPRPENRERLFQSIAHEGEYLHAPYPSNEIIHDGARFCQILAVHEGWVADAPEWAENPPGSNYQFPKPWETDSHVPADPKEFARVRDEAHRLGMKFVIYLSPLYSNSPDLFGTMERVLREYGVDGLYFDGWIGKRDDFRVGYHLMRRARAILGDRILYLHSSNEPFDTCAVYLPFVFAYADFVLGGESGRYGLEPQEFIRYVVSGHQISNAVGMWCYYGSWSDEPGYHDIPPKTEHIEMALQNHVRFWRRVTGPWPAKYPEEFARFDREYYGGLSRSCAEETKRVVTKPWQNRLIKKGTLNSPVVEQTPVIWKGRLLLIETWQGHYWDIPPKKKYDYYVRVRDAESGDILVGQCMKGYGFASALVWDGTLYVFAGRDTGDPLTRDVNVSKTDDLVNWSEPKKVVVPDNPDEYVYNQSVCYDGRRFVMAYETNDPAYPPFTLKFAVSDDLEKWTKLPEAIYGTDRYTACPALRYAGGYYYMLYLEHLTPKHWYETWLTRSKDLVHWEDAPHNPVIAPDPTRNVHPDCSPHSCTANGKEINASDPDLVEWQGKVRVYFTGGVPALGRGPAIR